MALFSTYTFIITENTNYEYIHFTLNDHGNNSALSFIVSTVKCWKVKALSSLHGLNSLRCFSRKFCYFSICRNFKVQICYVLKHIVALSYRECICWCLNLIFRCSLFSSLLQYDRLDLSITYFHCLFNVDILENICKYTVFSLVANVKQQIVFHVLMIAICYETFLR